ncbi:MAG: 30S ribosomal protein S6 [Candidatus Paceibacterota bacterium]
MKLKTAAKIKLYELTYLVPGSFTDSELTKVQEAVQALVKKHKGTVKAEDAWGKKSLAYDIRQAGKSYSEAHYVHLIVELDATIAQDFERGVYLNNDIIRHLLVEAEAVEKIEPEEKVKEELGKVEK